MKETINLSLPKCFEEIGTHQSFQDQLMVLEFNDSVSLKERTNLYPMRLKTSLLILVLSGEMIIGVDYLIYTLKKNMVMQLTTDNIIESITYTSNFKGFLMLFSSELKSELMAQTSGVRLPKSSQLKRSYPTQELNDEECQDVIARIDRIKKYIDTQVHIYSSTLIKNEVTNLQMELDYSRWKKHGDKEIEFPRNEMLREQFRELLLQKCKEHRGVYFYAEELCVTPDYLSKVIREYDGQSAMKWIVNAVVTEAKFLLRQPDKNINQVALELNFPDQSTFGKFFKRYTGITPTDFRKTIFYLRNY